MATTSKEITHKLYKTVFLMSKIADKLLASKLDLTLSQFRMLMAIGERGCVCQKDVAKFWEMTEAAVSRQVETLISKKFIRKAENAENRRACILTLAPAGEKALSKARRLLDSRYNEIYKVLSHNEQHGLDRSLEKLTDNICQEETA